MSTFGARGRFNHARRRALTALGAVHALHFIDLEGSHGTRNASCGTLLRGNLTVYARKALCRVFVGGIRAGLAKRFVSVAGAVETLGTRYEIRLVRFVHVEADEVRINDVLDSPGKNKCGEANCCVTQKRNNGRQTAQHLPLQRRPFQLRQDRESFQMPHCSNVCLVKMSRNLHIRC